MCKGTVIFDVESFDSFEQFMHINWFKKWFTGQVPSIFIFLKKKKKKNGVFSTILLYDNK